MRNYETVVIMDPTVGDEKAAAEVDRAQSIIASNEGEVIDVQKWGKRKLAYEIKKRREGLYTVIKFSGEGSTVSELERAFRMSESVLRFMTVVDLSPAKEETDEGEGGEEAAETQVTGTTEGAVGAPASEPAVDAGSVTVAPPADEPPQAGGVAETAETGTEPASPATEESPAAGAADAEEESSAAPESPERTDG